MWFSKLPVASIANFEQLSDSFVCHFIGDQRHKRSTSYLLTMKQQEGETLRKYVKHFNKAVLEIDEANDQVIMTTFQAGLNHPDLVFSRGKTLPTTMTDLLFKAQKYMNGEDALTANGVDGKRRMEEIDELQHKRKEKKDRSPSQKNDNENMQAHTRSTSIPEEELVTLNHTTTNNYLIHGM